MKSPSLRVRGRKAKGGRRVPASPFIDPDGFRIARGRAALSKEAAAGFLGVSERTIRNWEEGRSKIPYAAFKLLRCYSGFELPHPAWEGFSFFGETLWSPDRRAYRADDLGHLDMILAMAQYWRQDYERQHSSLAPLPSSNIVTFPASARASAAAQERAWEVEEPVEQWWPGVVKTRPSG